MKYHHFFEYMLNWRFHFGVVSIGEKINPETEVLRSQLASQNPRLLGWALRSFDTLRAAKTTNTSMICFQNLYSPQSIWKMPGLC